MKTNNNLLKVLALCAPFVIVGCSSSSSSGSGGDSANHCFTQDVQGDVINISNSCDDTIVVKTSEGDRRVIEPGAQQTLPRPNSPLARFAACFSPDEPEFDDNEFTCE